MGARVSVPVFFFFFFFFFFLNGITASAIRSALRRLSTHLSRPPICSTCIAMKRSGALGPRPPVLNMPCKKKLLFSATRTGQKRKEALTQKA